jgi:hypothetical protein
MRATYFAAGIAAAVGVTGAVGLSGTAQAAFLKSGLDEPFTFDFRSGSSTSGSVSAGFTANSTTATLTGSNTISRGSDGLGIDSGFFDFGTKDEVSGPSESLTVEFDSPFNLRSIGFTNAGTGAIDTTITVDVISGGTSVLQESFFSDNFKSDSSLTPEQEINTDANGNTTLIFANADGVSAVDEITFTSDALSSYTVAGISEVPLPAAAWLMIGGLGAIGVYARRARKAAPTA